MPGTSPALLRRRLPVLTLLAAFFATPSNALAAEPSGGEEFLAFIKAQADELRRNDHAPADLAAWKSRKAEVRS
ncbi:MAG: hypothetical protein U0835_19935, partial [Isosphaeraceae bacterium]